MSYKEMSRRLADLELAQDSVRTAQHGTAPEVWPRLAQWALAVHASGGWEVAQGIVNRGGLLAGPYTHQLKQKAAFSCMIWLCH